VENMSFFICPDTGKRYDIFGTGGAERTAKELEIPFLGEVPIQIPIREHGDAGKTAANYDDAQARPYLRPSAADSSVALLLGTRQRHRCLLSQLFERCVG